MEGKIVKGIAGFYYVHVVGFGLYECKAKGIFRKRKIKPLIGDHVEITILDEKEKTGNIIEILPRKNELIRPAVSNIDQAMVIFAAAQPDPNLNLLDRFLLLMAKQEVPVIICFNKKDIVEQQEQDFLYQIYEKCGYDVLFTSTYTKEGIDIVQEKLRGKTTVLAGPSGVGKSSMMNLLQPNANMETGAVSEKIKRGKHTTRHSEIIHIEGNTYVMDTPGFSSIWIDQFEKEELRNYFMEFLEFEPQCKFQGCLHINEPICGVKNAFQEGKISKTRYENYVTLYEELKEKRKY
ncbi:MAG: ribosome small subunit-dependent GTPase A [Firmicutes bacterium]|uniref:Small ribosomal subunit biogenesis GTPase RsgA n=1 Tax=Candidatus Scybalomonas excrementavium TaxID=2840943 RepID=A0A9D9N6T3_9FIRM|nr:ribosome small subunit-dependent GTPase A [Candidatus Scybalomonas excrementavium]